VREEGSGPCVKGATNDEEGRGQAKNDAEKKWALEEGRSVGRLMLFVTP